MATPPQRLLLLVVLLMLELLLGVPRSRNRAGTASLITSARQCALLLSNCNVAAAAEAAAGTKRQHFGVVSSPCLVVATTAAVVIATAGAHLHKCTEKTFLLLTLEVFIPRRLLLLKVPDGVGPLASGTGPQRRLVGQKVTMEATLRKVEMATKPKVLPEQLSGRFVPLNFTSLEMLATVWLGILVYHNRSGNEVF